MDTWCEELTHRKRPWCWERLKAGGEGDDRGWDGYMAASTWWTCIWVGSRSWWWTGKPGVQQSMGLQRVEHDRRDWTELNWGRIALLQIFLLELLLLHPIGFELCFHCHLFLEIFLISSAACWLFRNVLFNLHVFVFLTVFSCNWYLVS